MGRRGKSNSMTYEHLFDGPVSGQVPAGTWSRRIPALTATEMKARGLLKQGPPSVLLLTVPEPLSHPSQRPSSWIQSEGKNSQSDFPVLGTDLEL